MIRTKSLIIVTAILAAVPAFGAGAAVMRSETSHTVFSSFHACLRGGELSKVSGVAQACSIGSKAVEWREACLRPPSRA